MKSEDYEVTEDLLTPKKENPNQQNQPRKSMKNTTKIFLIVLAALIAIGGIVCQGYKKRKKNSKAERGNYTVNLQSIPSRVRPCADGLLVGNDKETYAFMYGDNSGSEEINGRLIKINHKEENYMFSGDDFYGKSLNVYDGWIYYISGKKICRKNLKSGEEMFVIHRTDTPLVFQIYDDKIYALFANDAYMQNLTSEAKCGLYSMSLDGAHVKKLTDDLLYEGFSIDNGYIYYEDSSSDNLKIKRMNLEGEEKKTISLRDKDAQDPYVQDGKLYYLTDTKAVIYDLKTKKTKMADLPDGDYIEQFIYLPERKTFYFVTCDNDFESTYSIWCTNLDGNGRKEVYRARTTVNGYLHMYMSKDGIYFYDDPGTDGGKIHMYYIDSKNKVNEVYY